MKKLLTAIVISALCLGLCSGALAEGENVISADDFNGPAHRGSRRGIRRVQSGGSREGAKGI